MSEIQNSFFIRHRKNKKKLLKKEPDNKKEETNLNNEFIPDLPETEETFNLENQKVTFPEQIRSLKKEIKKKYFSITIFGFSESNKNNILNLIYKKNVSKIIHGKNFLVCYFDNHDYESLIELNKTTLNGEFIGVFKNEIGKQGNYKRRNVFFRMFEYLFGWLF